MHPSRRSSGRRWVACSQAHHVLHDGEDPGNDWIFGPKAELFQYRFVDFVHAPSGFVALVEDAASLLSGADSRPKLDLHRRDSDDDWQSILDFARDIEAGMHKPGSVPDPVAKAGIVWVGRIVMADHVAVYTTPKRGESPTGLLLQSYEPSDE